MWSAFLQIKGRMTPRQLQEVGRAIATFCPEFGNLVAGFATDLIAGKEELYKVTTPWGTPWEAHKVGEKDK